MRAFSLTMHLLRNSQAFSYEVCVDGCAHVLVSVNAFVSVCGSVMGVGMDRRVGLTVSVGGWPMPAHTRVSPCQEIPSSAAEKGEEDGRTWFDRIRRWKRTRWWSQHQEPSLISSFAYTAQIACIVF